MPPLLLDDDEAVAVAVGLRTAAEAGVTGLDELSVRALAKLEQLLPSRLRQRVSALSRAAVTLPIAGGPAVDPDTLAVLAAACVSHEKIRFAYTAAHGEATRRLAEPHRLVASGRRWYLVAYDVDRAAWRSFRVDRMGDLHRTGTRVPARALPGGVDVATWVGEFISAGRDTCRARLLIHAPIEQAAARVPSSFGVLEPVDERTCRLLTVADAPGYLADRIAVLGLDYTLLDPPELAAHLRRVAVRAQRAIEHLTMEEQTG
jgi:predicted DNA-binding transcriptional regulator YafY